MTKREIIDRHGFMRPGWVLAAIVSAIVVIALALSVRRVARMLHPLHHHPTFFHHHFTPSWRSVIHVDRRGMPDERVERRGTASAGGRQDDRGGG
jgi:hypothetical protein